MSTVTCPECSATTAYLLTDVSGVSYVDWYRCAKCGNVWCLDKPREIPSPLKTEPQTGGEPENRRPLRHALRTTLPPAPPPALRCPHCDRSLKYLQSVVSGVRPVEQWDRFQCRQCEVQLEYRHRTRRLKILPRR
jgi:transposase-like protein